VEPTEVLYKALEALIEITGAERAFPLMADPASGEMKFTLSRNFEERTTHGTSFAVRRSIVDQNAAVREHVLVSTPSSTRLRGRSVEETIYELFGLVEPT